ncbi:MAG: DNA polymerase III subunit beta [Oscillospiraceae bacterium]|jgi:DNA polymerase-3 subunit beta|nr:DNA polymerase III subunit beta [Oscillospiraceae bacterium]
MKFSCEKAVLLPALTNVSRAVPARSGIAALEGVLIEAGETIRLTGFNLEVGVRQEVEADIEAPGAVIVSARLLGDIVRRLPDDVISFSLNDKLVMHISCGQAVYDIASCLEGDAYPQMPEVVGERAAVLPQKALREMIRGTLFAVSDNDAKVVHTGSRFIWEDGGLTLVSVDGYRLALRRQPVEGAPPPEDFVVPGQALRELERLLSDEEDKTVSLILGGRHILFELGGATLITRLLDGDFLNYKTAVPQEQPITARLSARALADSIERVSLLVSEKIKNPVRVKVDGNGLLLSCVTALGSAQDFCPAQVDGALPEHGLEIGFNHRYLLDALRALPDEECVLLLQNPLSPCVIAPTEGNGFVYMILPVRLRAE